MTAERFLVWGAGGHARVVADVVRAGGGVVVGFVDRDPGRVGSPVDPSGRVVASEAGLLAGDAAGAEWLALGIGDNRLRQACLRRAPLELPARVHPSAWVSPSARIGAGTVVMPMAVVNACAVLGGAVIVNTAAVVEHDCELADAVHLSPGAVLTGGVRVGERSWIGAGATVLPHVRIGADAMVGAGAVVLRDVPDGATVVGNPARALERRRATPP